MKNKSSKAVEEMLASASNIQPQEFDAFDVGAEIYASIFKILSEKIDFQQPIDATKINEALANAVGAALSTISKNQDYEHSMALFQDFSSKMSVRITQLFWMKGLEE